MWFSACAKVPTQTQLPDDGSAYWPAASWRTSTPDSAGIPAGVLQGFSDGVASGAIPDVTALVVIRHGFLVWERYFNGSSATDVHTMQSVSKSVTSLVTGIAIDNGALATTSTLGALLQNYAALGIDTVKRHITIGDLLAMRSGINFFESPYAGSPLEQLNTSNGDWVSVALAPAMNAAPGQLWQYNSGGPIIIARAVQLATGVPFQQYASEHLFAPIGITTERWYASPFDGLPHTGGGLNLRALDLARIGYLVLRGGRWDGTQVVSAGWLAASMQPRTTRPRTFGAHQTDYGYLWWLFPIDPARPTSDAGNVVYTASGNLGQWLFVVPSLDLVVVTTGRGNSSFTAPADLVFGELIPALR